MAISQAQYKATNKYKAKHYKRIPLDVTIELKDKIKAAADAAGETVNGYVKTAIMQRMERDAAETLDRESAGEG